MPRGKVKKTDSANLMVKKVTKKTNTDKVVKPKIDDVTSDIKTTTKVVCKCDLCGKDIHCSPVNINLTYLTGKASWHRFCADRFRVCDKCAEELSTVIDNFIIKKNKNLKRWSVDG